MSRHSTIRTSLAIAAAALAIGATSAGAMPARDGTPPVKGPHAAELDPGHASLVQEHSATLAAQQTRAYALAHGAHPSTTRNVSAPDSAQPVATDDGDVPLIGIILGLTGAGILAAGAAAAVSKTTRSRSTRVA